MPHESFYGPDLYSGRVIRIRVTTKAGLVSESMVLALREEPEPERYARWFAAPDRDVRVVDVGEFADQDKRVPAVLYARQLTKDDPQSTLVEGDASVFDQTWPSPGRMAELASYARTWETTPAQDPWFDAEVCSRLFTMWMLSHTMAYLVVVPVGDRERPSHRISEAVDVVRSSIGRDVRLMAPISSGEQYALVLDGMVLVNTDVNSASPREL
jgi:hypothetical protein